jgi:hypothetical protein
LIRSSGRLSSTFYNFFSTCGCSQDDKKIFTPECFSLDLGEVYNNLTCYEEESPCDQCCYPRGEGEEDYCTEHPHGYNRKKVRRACAKLVVFKNSRVINGDFTYDDALILHSRQRNALPQFNECELNNPLQCPAENGLNNVPCFQTCTFDETTISYGYYFGGPFTEIETEEDPSVGNCTGCRGIIYNPTSNWKSQEMGFGFSPCMLEEASLCGGFCDEMECVDSIQNIVLAGYAIDTEESWLIDDQEEIFQTIKDAIIEHDPYGAFSHTVYVHYEIQTALIQCCSLNERRLSGLRDKEEREKAVFVQAAIGFSCQLCGLDPDKACEKLYEE